MTYFEIPKKKIVPIEDQLREENERLQKELDQIYKRPPRLNPIHWACLSCHDQSAEEVGFTNFEFANTDSHGDPVFVFDVEALTPKVLKVLNYLEENLWYLGKRLRDLERPFPQEHSGAITICAMPPECCDALRGVDPAFYGDWETLYKACDGWDLDWFPVVLNRLMEKAERELARDRGRL